MGFVCRVCLQVWVMHGSVHEGLALHGMSQHAVEVCPALLLLAFCGNYSLLKWVPVLALLHPLCSNPWHCSECHPAPCQGEILM